MTALTCRRNISLGLSLYGSYLSTDILLHSKDEGKLASYDPFKWNISVEIFIQCKRTWSLEILLYFPARKQVWNITRMTVSFLIKSFPFINLSFWYLSYLTFRSISITSLGQLKQYPAVRVYNQLASFFWRCFIKYNLLLLILPLYKWSYTLH